MWWLKLNVLVLWLTAFLSFSSRTSVSFRPIFTNKMSRSKLRSLLSEGPFYGTPGILIKIPGGHSIVKNMGGGNLDSLGSGILVGKRYFGVLQKQ